MPNLKLILILLLSLIAFNVAGADEIKTGYASWYSIASCKRENTWQKYGGKTASGEVFDDKEFTCASWDYPFNTLLRITNLHNGKSVLVRVNDRGPAKKLYKKGRIADLSKRAFSKLANLEQGLIQVKVEKAKR